MQSRHPISNGQGMRGYSVPLMKHGDYLKECVKVYESTCLEYGAFTMWDLGKVVGSAFGYRYETWIEDA